MVVLICYKSDLETAIATCFVWRERERDARERKRLIFFSYRCSMKIKCAAAFVKLNNKYSSPTLTRTNTQHIGLATLNML